MSNRVIVNYINKNELKEYLVQYEQLNDDITEWYLRSDLKMSSVAKRKSKKMFEENTEDFNKNFIQNVNKQKDFIEKKKKIRDQRIHREKSETEIERKIRQKQLNKVKNSIGKCFLLIAENFIKRPEYIGYDYQRKCNMISDATEIMLRYIEGFDTDLDNPLAYFTQQCKNAFIQNIKKENEHRESEIPFTFIDEVGGEKLMIGEFD